MTVEQLMEGKAILVTECSSDHSAPLRDRRSDIPLLTAFFVELFARQFGKQISGVAQGTMELLSRLRLAGKHP